MVVTVFGDVVSQHGGWIWLGSLIKALALFGFSERLVRTAVFRVVQQDWLKVNKIGRRSYYCFTDTAKSHYEKAARRIYAGDKQVWDGTWTLVSPVFVPEEQRDELRKSLLWQGYNSLVSGMLAHPSADRASLNETLAEMELTDKVLVFTASTPEVQSQATLKKLVKEKWNLRELQGLYNDYLSFYRPLVKDFARRLPPPEESFILRTLLIHDYRRILLRDPDFPDEMLPTGWVGFEAHELLARAYDKLAANSIEYIEQCLENAQGPMPAAGARFYRRYDGIRQ